MEQFSLEKYLENPSRKVVTRDRRKVRIICTDCKSSALPIIAEIQNPKTNTWFIDFFNIDGTTEIDKQKQRDLFFTDEEKELTEFEKELINAFDDAQHHTASKGVVFAKKYKEKLFDLARKEILKDLPKWKKTVQDYYHQGNIPCTNPTISGDEEYLMVGTYEIKISDLETLPKEE